jgi:bacterioferritin-associated ferredoxin
MHTEMADTVQDTKNNIICRCSGTTLEHIGRLLDRGIDDLDGISRATGACSGGGACDTDILACVAACRARMSHNADTVQDNRGKP